MSCTIINCIHLKTADISHVLCVCGAYINNKIGECNVNAARATQSRELINGKREKEEKRKNK